MLAYVQDTGSTVSPVCVEETASSVVSEMVQTELEADYEFVSQ